MKMSAYNELVEKAKLYNHFGLAKAEEHFTKACGNEYPKAAIETALYNARGMYMQRTTKELMYLLANNSEFVEAEQELFKATKKIFDLLVEFDQMHNIKAKQSNEVLLQICNHIKDNLFNLTPLNKNV